MVGGAHPTNVMSRRRKKTLVLIGLTLPMLYYVGCIHRVRETVERDGWLLQWTYKPFQCRHCWGRVERLEYRGQTVTCPPEHEFAGEHKRYLLLQTPVGAFERSRGGDRWIVLTEKDSRPHTVCGKFIEAELQRGHYESENCRKTGTPEHWCHAVAEYRSRWVSPDLIATLSW
jgi:hypothetical protein